MKQGALTPGDVLRGRFLIKEVIGEGSFGKVYLAEDREVQGALWAVKEIWDSNMTDEERLEAIDLYTREVAILRTLNHTGVPKVLDFFSDGEGRHYFVMEYIEGRTLNAVLEQETIDAERAVTWALRLCDILEHLHSLKPAPLIYRDLKPSNVMVTPRGRLLLIDFGISRFFNPQKLKDTNVLGTPGFCPPEQYGKSQSDARSDIYALGATLYHLLTEEDLAQFNFAIPPVTTLNSAVPPGLEKLMSRCLEPDPSKRYQSVKSLREDLLRLSRQISGLYGPSAPPRPQLIPGRPRGSILSRIPAVIYLWAVFLAFFLGGLAFEPLLIFSGLVLCFIPIISIVPLPFYIGRKMHGHTAASILSLLVLGVLVFQMISSFGVKMLTTTAGRESFNGCQDSLKKIAGSMDLYANDNNGFYPDTQEKLTPAYLRTIPTCPASRGKPYEYQVSDDSKTYTMWCGGMFHRPYEDREGFPRYDSSQGFVTP
ncbi:MAG: serine/threonine-protein kinase [Candidatus Eremiobacteraeota bacterium]|nr:serine/threonine-protein kinase [Candidatus Eremiobacteraeota bacterium]